MTKAKDRQITALGKKSLAVTAFALCSLGWGCGNTQRAMVEAPPAFQATPETTQLKPELKMATVAAPKLAEVKDAVTRVFKDAVVIDTSFNPSFLAGDFNGDSSQDIAVIVKPAPGKLSNLNEEFPAWLLRDPFADKRAPGELHVEERDVLLAVIHGFGDNDWRDPQATQTFLLKNAVGPVMESHTGNEILSAHAGRKLPQLKGDVIGEVLHGTPGYLYFAGATYSWYDPKTFKGELETEKGMVHKPRPMSK